MPQATGPLGCYTNTACGAWIEPLIYGGVYLKDDPKKVDCARCLRTRAWKEAAQ